jgi:hypothetical protein
VRDAFATDMLVRRDPGELYALRHDMPVGGLRSRPVQGWVLRRALPVLARSAAARRASLRTGRDQLVVLDLDTGAEKARTAVPSPTQAFFPAPGFGRDLNYPSLTTIVRIAAA